MMKARALASCEGEMAENIETGEFLFDRQFGVLWV